MFKPLAVPLVINTIGRLAAMLMLYFIFSKQSSLWLFYLPLFIIAMCMVALPVYKWRHDQKKEAKQDLVKYVIVFAVIILSNFLF
jgi:hypothetical protein